MLRETGLPCRDALATNKPLRTSSSPYVIPVQRASKRLVPLPVRAPLRHRSEEHTSELQSLMRISYAVFCLKKKTTYKKNISYQQNKHKSQHKTNAHLSTE